MKKKLYTILMMLMVAMLVVTPVFARGAIKLSGSFGVGSIHFSGYATGVGGYQDGITLEILGIGIPEVTCTNQGGNESPGQNPSKVTVGGEQFISPDQIEATTKKGKTPVNVSADESVLVITGTQGGCPNDNWTATITSIVWTGAVINVYDGLNTSGTLLQTFEFVCDPALQVGDTLSCKQVSP